MLQELWYTVITLGWWRIILIIIAVLLIGIVVSTLIFFLTSRYVYKEPIKYSDTLRLLVNKYKTHMSADSESVVKTGLVSHEAVIESSTNQGGSSSNVESISSTNELLAEFDNNLVIIKNFDGKVLPTIKNTALFAYLSSTDNLSPDLRNQLTRVCTDIGLWNNLVWITTELSQQNSFSNDLYQKSILNITNELVTIRQIIVT